MYNVLFAKSFLKDMKKIPKEVQKEVLNKWIPKLQENPRLGSNFSGKNLKKFLRLPFRFKKNDYRMVYTIHNKKITFTLLAIGNRENFYKKLKRKRL